MSGFRTPICLFTCALRTTYESNTIAGTVSWIDICLTTFSLKPQHEYGVVLVDITAWPCTLLQIPLSVFRWAVAVTTKQMNGVRLPSSVRCRSAFLSRAPVSSSCFVPLPSFYTTCKVGVNTTTQEGTRTLKDEIACSELLWSQPAFTFLPFFAPVNIDKRTTTVLLLVLPLLSAMAVTWCPIVVAFRSSLSLKQM